ncbi:MAG: hypothetical protein Q4D13_08605 [Erysipelotrichaceae bacterium]|nr:hypothetical protein [Erysipelotrichaceae bacterium]
MLSKKELLDIIQNEYPLKRIDKDDISSLKVSVMNFDIEHYEAEGLGNVSFMHGEGLFGLMKMDTMIINPFDVDMPLYSYDYIKALGNVTLLIELDETRINKKEISDDFNKIIESLNAYTDYELKSSWYDNIRLPMSFAKKGKKKDETAFDKAASEYLLTFLKNCKTADRCNREEKIKASQFYTEGLLKNGGTSTDMFIKTLGQEKTQKIFREVLFATGTPEKGE